MESSNKKENTSGLRCYRINLRLTEAEYKKVMATIDQTLYKSLSSYARKLLLGKPVAVIYRDRTKDVTYEELAAVRKELSAIANNFNQVVKRIHKLEALPHKQYWLMNCTKLEKELLEKISKIQLVIEKIADIWSQKS